jgi:hypothetical protein
MKNYKLFFLLLTVCNSIIAQSNAIFDKLNFNLPQLELVKKMHDSGNNKNALRLLLELYRQKENLYLKVSKSDLEYFKSNYRYEVNNTLKTADEVLKHEFIFRDEWDLEKSTIPYRFKGKIDWKTIPDGDIEWCYMLNRHKFWVDLGKAYLLTADEKYAKEFVFQANQWIDNNPLDDKLKKYSWRRIEAGIRCENWIKSFEYFKNSKYITPEFLVKFLNSLNQHAQYINNSFSDFSKTSNWGVIEFQGLFNVSQFLTEFKENKKWETDALNNLSTCIQLQILEDGAHWEQSPMYHNAVFHCFMNVNLLAQRNHIILPEIIVQKTKQMALVNVQWQKPNYHEPLLGDSDDNDLRSLLTLSSFLFHDSVLKSRAFKTLDYENFYIMGKENGIIYENLVDQQPDFLSAYQQSSGDFYMRSSWKENATYAGFHIKKLGCGHGHDNLLHFTLFANGKDYLVDGGRYTYVDNQWREFFKNNKSHNTLGVDDLTNSIYSDSWSNSFEARSQGIFTKIESSFDYAEAENTAYKRLIDPVSVKRRLLFIKPNIWVLFDSFSANGEHKFSQYFNFPNDSIQIEDGALRTKFKENNLIIQPVKKAEIKVTDSWWSPDYNSKIESKRAEVFSAAKGFTSFITLLYFPDETNLKYEKIPVYNRNNKLLPDEVAEALNIVVDDKTYTIFVVHNSPIPADHFFIVDKQIISGEVVIIEKYKGKSTIKIIKE